MKNTAPRLSYPITTQSATAGAALSGIIDTYGAGHLRVRVITSTTDNATNTPSVLKLSESSDTNATTFSDITPAVGGGVGGFTLPAGVTQATSAPFVQDFDVSLARRRRYIRVQVTPRTTQLVTAIAELTPHETTDLATAGGRNVKGIVTI